MKDIKRVFNLINIGSIVIDILFVIFGIFLVADPAVGLESALLLTGIFLLISGIYSIIKYIMNSHSIFKLELIYGLLSVIAGLFAVFKPFSVANLITIIVGIWLIISSVTKFSIALEFKRLKNEGWIFDLAISILTLILGLLLLFNPFEGIMILSTYAGIMLIIYSSMDIIEQFFIRKRASQLVKLLSK